jgi:fructose-specific phosphotransferase system component IIB
MQENKISDIIYSVFVMICVTACFVFIAYTYIPDENEENKQPQVNQELIEIKRVGEE